MTFLEKIFSIRNEHLYKVITIFGIKLKFYNVKSAVKNYLKPSREPLVFLHRSLRSIWYESEHIDEFFSFSRLLYHSPYLWKTMPYHFWLFILSAFVQKGNLDEAEKIFDNYIYFHGDNGLDEYFYTAEFAQSHGITNPEIEQTLFILNNIKNENRFEEFKNYLKGKSIAVVGSSGCELGKNKGAEIDSHDIVIRFNNYPQIDKYVKDYGKKTTIWVLQTSPGVVYKPDISEYDYVLWAENKDLLYVRPNARKIFYDYLTNTSEKIINIPPKFFYELKKESKLLHPTTGATVIYMLCSILGNLENVDVYGFAFIDNNEKDTDHFFDGLCDLKTGHYFDKEVSFMNKFYNDNHFSKR